MIVTPDTVSAAVAVQPPGLIDPVGMLKCDGEPLVQVAFSVSGPHETGVVT